MAAPAAFEPKAVLPRTFAPSAAGGAKDLSVLREQDRDRGGGDFAALFLEARGGGGRGRGRRSLAAAASETPVVAATSGERFVLKVAEDDGGAFLLAEAAEGLVNQRRKVIIQGGTCDQGTILGGDGFTAAATLLGAQGLEGGEAGRVDEPAGEGCAFCGF